MATRVAATVLPTLSLLLLLAGTPARGGDDDSAFVYAGCSQGRYVSGSPYASGVDSVLTSLANSAPLTPYANTSSPGSPPSPAVVGLYQCRSDLPAAVCTGCVRSAISRLSSLCSWATGGAVQLRSCFVRYGNDSFVGKPDTAVLFKKCGGSPGDAGGAAMRDSALGELASSVAPAGVGYRTGGSGGVQAMSQCVGDLSAKACSDCVSTAAGQLRAGCGYATAGEVYLGKCYARFWANGAGFSSGAAGNGRWFAPRMYGEHVKRLGFAAAGGSFAYLSLVFM